MSTFKTTTISTLPAIIEPLSESAKFWKNNVQPATVYRELNSINHVDINEYNQILATSAANLSLYNLESSEKKRTYQSPNHTILYCGNFRRENQKLFATGADDGVVRIWELKKSKPLRLLGSDNNNEQKQKHSAPVHRVDFHGLNQIFSCGDDKQVKLWDFIEEKIVCKFNSVDRTTAHDDYIRASCLVENASLYATGSYDHTVKLWDPRQPQKSCQQYKHKQSVESITNRDLLIISSSDCTIQIFDVVAGKILRTLENVHHKTITCVHNHDSCLLTASIDGHLKIFDYNFNVITSFNYQPSQLLTCHYNGSYLAVGTNNGILSVNKVSSKSKALKSSAAKQQSSSYSSDNEVGNEFLFHSIPKSKKLKFDKKNTFIINEDNIKINADLKQLYRQEKHEQLLRKFKYSMALNRVMTQYWQTDPEKVINFMQELIRRSGIQQSLASRSFKDLKRIIRFICANFADIRYQRILLDVSLILVGIYEMDIKNNKQIRFLFRKLHQCINNEITVLHQMSEIDGQLQFLINSQIK